LQAQARAPFVKPLEIRGDPDSDGAALREQIASRLALLGASHAQIPRETEKLHRIADELARHIESPAAPAAMEDLVARMRSVRIRGLGSVNDLWPRLFFVETGTPLFQVDVTSAQSAELWRALRRLFEGVVSGGTPALLWAAGAVLARRPDSCESLQALLAEADPAFADATLFRRAWGAYFTFSRTKTANQPDWSYYWDRERSTAYGDKYPAAIHAFLADFLRSLKASDPRARILDIGTGNHAATKLAATISEDFDLHGIDLAPPPPSAGASVLLARMNAERLGFAGGSFVAALSVNGIEYANPGRALPELARILRPGGRAALVLHRPDSLVVRRALAVNAFVRGHRLPEALALAALHIEARPEGALRIVERQLLGLERDRDGIGAEPFFVHLVAQVRDALRHAPSAPEKASRAVQWCREFLDWVLHKNDYLSGHAARLGEDEHRLVAVLGGFGLQVLRAETLHMDAPDSSIAAWGVELRKAG
jgi:SAM-dependent methyltransferase